MTKVASGLSANSALPMALPPRSALKKLVRPNAPPRTAPAAGPSKHSPDGDRDGEQAEGERADRQVPQRCVRHDEYQRQQQRELR